MEINPKGLVISLNEKLMFDSGKAEIYEEAKLILSDISNEIIDIPNSIRIEGHTDSVPIKTAKFPSNWELSASRAANVARYLIEVVNFPPGRLSAGGYSKYHPAVQTSYDDIIFEYKEMVKKAPFKYSDDLARAKTEEEKEIIHKRIRDDQLALQMEMQQIIKDQLISANSNAALRSLNRRVDIIVLRLGSGIKKRSVQVTPEPALNSG
jgi:flagellar motor protein MotB